MGWWILGALWGTVFTILRTPFTIAQAAVDAAVAPLEDHQGPGPGPHGGAGGRGGARAGGVAVLGLEADGTKVKALPPAYQADPRAAARGPDLNSDLADSDIRLPGAPRRHHSAAVSAASFPRSSARDSVIPEMPPEMELLPRLPRNRLAASDDARAEAAAARASAMGAADRAQSCALPADEGAGEGSKGEPAKGGAAAIMSPGEEERSRQAFVKFYTGGCSRVEYE